MRGSSHSSRRCYLYRQLHGEWPQDLYIPAVLIYCARTRDTIWIRLAQSLLTCRNIRCFAGSSWIGSQSLTVWLSGLHVLFLSSWLPFPSFPALAPSGDNSCCWSHQGTNTWKRLRNPLPRHVSLGIIDAHPAMPSVEDFLSLQRLLAIFFFVLAFWGFTSSHC